MSGQYKLTDGNLWEFVRHTPEELEAEYQKALATCYTNRIAEYPKAEDYLDAGAKGNTKAQADWKAQQLAVKAKYPKPLREDFGI